MWDLDANLLATLDHDAAVRSAQFSPDGTRIVTTIFDPESSLDESAYVWQSLHADQARVELERRLAGRQFTPQECAQYGLEPCPNG